MSQPLTRLILDPATPPHMLRPKHSTPINLSWNILLGEPTPDPAKLNDLATPPELLVAKQGTPVQLGWAIPLGEPTPDPA